MDSDGQVIERAGPLRGIRVVDLTSALMGPYCTQILADLGADVIKVESPDGDTTRALGAGHHRDHGGMFANMNRGKRSVALDLKRSGGRDALIRLVDGADVFVHSIRRAALERLGLGYADLATRYPKLVYASLVGFGAGGPYADLPAYDDVIQAASGLVSLQHELGGGDPTYVATVLCDKTAGLTGVYAITAALFERERSGHGQEVEVPMFETMASYVLAEHIVGAFYDPPLERPTYARVVSAGRRPYRTMDGHISVLIYNDGQWSRFLDAIGRPPWSRNPRFASLQSRGAEIDLVLEALAREFLLRTNDEWLTLLRRAEIPAMPLQTTTDLFDDEHLDAVGFWQSSDVDGHRVRYPGIPTSFSRTPGRITGPGPGLGEHGRQVLVEHGFSVDEIDDLVDEGALIDPAR